MATEGFECIIPSDPAEQKRLKIMIEEAVACMIRADGEREHKKEVISAIKESFQLDSSILNMVIKMRHKQTFTQVHAKQQATQDLYTKLYGEQEGIEDV